MAEITMCPGGLCPQRKSCYRHRAVSSSVQAYFTEPPNDREKCEYFWEIKDNYKLQEFVEDTPE